MHYSLRVLKWIGEGGLKKGRRLCQIVSENGHTLCSVFLSIRNASVRKCQIFEITTISETIHFNISLLKSSLSVLFSLLKLLTISIIKLSTVGLKTGFVGIFILQVRFKYFKTHVKKIYILTDLFEGTIQTFEWNCKLD